MSDDWLIFSSTPLDFTDVILAVDAVDPLLQLRADHSQRFTVLVDAEDRPRLWVGPSREAHDLAPAAQRFVPQHDPSEAAPWWTEVVAPASAYERVSTPSATVRDLSAALAHQVDGMAIHLSSDQPEDALRAPSADADDPPFDFVTADSAVALQTRTVLGLTPWVTTCLLWARDHERTFVLLTPHSTRLTPVLAAMVDRGAIQWIADDGEITHDVRTAAEMRWNGSSFVPVDPPSPVRPETSSVDRVWSLVAEVDTVHSASDPVSVGALAQHVAHACGVGPLTGQGLMEPVEGVFDQASLTTFSQSEAPGPARFVLNGEHADAVGSLVPQPVGLLERVELFGQAPQDPFDEDELLALGQDLLTQGAQLAVVGYRLSAPARLRDVWPVGPVLPGLIAIRDDRFPTLPEEELRAVSPSGTVRANPSEGWLMPFPAPADISHDQSTDLLQSWAGVLDLLSRHDALTQAQAAQTS